MDVKHDVFPGGALMGLPVLVFKEGGSPLLELGAGRVYKVKIWMWPLFSSAFCYTLNL
jgi:hypothetical protein